MTLTNILQRAILDLRLAITSILCGNSATVSLSIGQKFPFALSSFTWRAAETLIPVAAKQAESPVTRAPELLKFGTRISLGLAAPGAVALSLIAGSLLHAWLGRDMPEVVGIMRIASLAVVADACGLAALHLLWGEGRGWSVFLIFAGSAALCLSVTWTLAPHFGPVAAAYGLLASATSGSIGFLVVACKYRLISVLKLLVDCIAGLLFPLLILGGVIFAIGRTYHGDLGAPRLLLAVALGTLCYLLTLYWLGMSQEERAAARVLLDRARSRA